MFPAQWYTEERFWRKNQRIWHIKQGSDIKWTEIGGPKLTDIYYNTVAPFKILKLFFSLHSLSITKGFISPLHSINQISLL